MGIEIYALRHGESSENVHGIIQGKRHGTLTIRGEDQAIARGQSFLEKGIYFDMVFSSDQGRAVYTTHLVLEQLGIKPEDPRVEYSAELRERGFGALEGLTYEEAKVDISQIAMYYAMDQEGIFRESESLSSLKNRINGFKNRILIPDSRILVVSHDYPISCLVNDLLGEDLSKETYHPLDNCGYHLIVLDNNGKVLGHELAEASQAWTVHKD